MADDAFEIPAVLHTRQRPARRTETPVNDQPVSKNKSIDEFNAAKLTHPQTTGQKI